MVFYSLLIKFLFIQKIAAIQNHKLLVLAGRPCCNTLLLLVKLLLATRSIFKNVRVGFEYYKKIWVWFELRVLVGPCQGDLWPKLSLFFPKANIFCNSSILISNFRMFIFDKFVKLHWCRNTDILFIISSISWIIQLSHLSNVQQYWTLMTFAQLASHSCKF